jgi:hypothetical protein
LANLVIFRVSFPFTAKAGADVSIDDVPANDVGQNVQRGYPAKEEAYLPRPILKLLIPYGGKPLKDWGGSVNWSRYHFAPNRDNQAGADCRRLAALRQVGEAGLSSETAICN